MVFVSPPPSTPTQNPNMVGSMLPPPPYRTPQGGLYDLVYKPWFLFLPSPTQTPQHGGLCDLVYKPWFLYSQLLKKTKGWGDGGSRGQKTGKKYHILINLTPPTPHPLTSVQVIFVPHCCLFMCFQMTVECLYKHIILEDTSTKICMRKAP